MGSSDVPGSGQGYGEIGGAPLAKSGQPPAYLDAHLEQVAAYARAAAEAYRGHWALLLGESLAAAVGRALVLAAITHDLGKATKGFQRTLCDPGYRWEFRHEALSAALLLSGTLARDQWLALAVAAVLTHHREVDDQELRNNSGWVPLPDPEVVAEAVKKFRAKALELEPYWDWLRDFWQAHPDLRELPFPDAARALQPPAAFLKELQRQLDGLKVPDNPAGLALLLTRGWLMAADHAASAGVLDFKAELPQPAFPAPRRFQDLLGEHEGDAFLEAPTGSGKTVAALRWVLRNRRGGERVFYLLPYQASIEAMADTLEGYFGRENVGVLHARALDYLFREYFEKSGEYDTAYVAARSEAELNRLVHKPVKVATPFQLLKWLFGVPRFEIGVSEMVGGLFVFDEIHAYDAHVVALIVEMVRVIKALGGRCLFMSATFPEFLKLLLQEALGGEPADFALAESGLDEWARQFLSLARHRLRWRDTTLEQLYPEIIRAAKEGQRVLVVANRVAQAQELFRSLSREIDGVHLLHSRLTRRDRVAREQRVIGAIKGKVGDRIRVLVATQVIEVSLDISFDLIFTEVAPVDDLLQRFGRVNRYAEHPGGVEVHVARVYDVDRVKWVYRPEWLRRTLETAPADGTLISAEVGTRWVQDVYRDGWTDPERRRFEAARAAFRGVLEVLRPLQRLPEAKEEFYGLFQSVEILPRRFYDEFIGHQEQKQYLLASELLVPVPLGTFQMLNQQGRIRQIAGRVLLADVAYDDELGLLPREVDLDVNII